MVAPAIGLWIPDEEPDLWPLTARLDAACE